MKSLLTRYAPARPPATPEAAAESVLLIDAELRQLVGALVAAEERRALALPSPYQDLPDDSPSRRFGQVGGNPEFAAALKAAVDDPQAARRYRALAGQL